MLDKDDAAITGAAADDRLQLVSSTSSNQPTRRGVLLKT